jgi:hypothetical protein
LQARFVQLALLVALLAVAAVATDSELGAEAESTSGVMAQSSILLRHREATVSEMEAFSQWISKHHKELLEHHVRTDIIPNCIRYVYHHSLCTFCWY